MTRGRPRAEIWFLLISLSFLSACGSSHDPGQAPVETTAISQWNPFETVLNVPVDVRNPFDPTQILMEVTFLAPDGSVFTIPAFATQEFDRSLVGNFEVLTPRAGLEWRVRFTPTQVGIWQWKYSFTSSGKKWTSPWSSFSAGEPLTGHHGFLRRSPDDDRYLRFDDGTPYFAVGENLSWYDGRGTYAYDNWLEKLARQGVNYIRLWMPSWAFSLEWIERDGSGAVVRSSLGNYESRLDRAWQLDQVLHRAEELGIFIMLCIQNHGPFSLEHNSEWVDNPYNVDNGGPLLNPREFFTDRRATELFKHRLRYIVGRWGYSPNILAWELWNEVDLPEQPGIAELVAWHREMVDELYALDPYDRLVTTSLGGVPTILEFLLDCNPYRPLWEMSEMDFVQIHFYTVGEIPVNFASLFPLLVENMWCYGKPTLIAEAGVDFRGPVETVAADPEGVGFHDMLWAGIFSGSFGTGMSWWWDNVIDPEDLYFHFGPVALFVDGVVFDREGFLPGGAGATAPGKRLDAYALRGETTILAWVKNSEHQWYHPEPSSVEAGVLILEEIAGHSWSMRWLDTYTGETVGAYPVQVIDGSLTIPVPTFARDIAIRLERIR